MDSTRLITFAWLVELNFLFFGSFIHDNEGNKLVLEK